MNNDIAEILRTSELGTGFRDDQLEQLAHAMTERTFASGEIVFRQDDPGDSLLIVAKGRVKISVSRSGGKDTFVDHLAVGEHFGEMAMLTGGPRVVTMSAVLDSTLLELQQSEFQRLMDDMPGLAANLSRTLGFRLRRETSGKRSRNVDRSVGLVQTSHRTRSVLPLIAASLTATAEPIHVLNDVSFAGASECRFTESPTGQDADAEAEWLRENLSQQPGHEGHTLIGYRETESTERRLKTLPQCEQIWWLVEPNQAEKAAHQLSQLLKANPSLVHRIYWVWVLEADINPNQIPAPPEAVVHPDFKVLLDGSTVTASRLQKQSISRLVRHLRRTRLGLALGGGAARGLAHLGVLKALEREEIYFDLITGTSAGALMALPYSFGWDADQTSQTFAHDLTPSWPFRMLPRGGQWFMAYKYRTRGWDSMLKRHFGDVKLEQLPIPLSTVAADLITGAEVVRDRGHAVNGVLESINLPQIAKPILRDGMALVDGGIINNVPSDLLPERGADLVIGVNISAKMSHRFGGNTPGLADSKMKNAGQFETIMRSNEVQDHLITDLRTSDTDFMFNINTSDFEFTDFTQAKALAEVGEQAATEMIPQLKQLLAEQEQSEAVTPSSQQRS
ncbi:MAG: cyclic nucleotide-binding and patatin-like phospholipase domain-containing protein [Fuerstiella sp.]